MVQSTSPRGNFSVYLYTMDCQTWSNHGCCFIKLSKDWYLTYVW